MLALASDCIARLVHTRAGKFKHDRVKMGYEERV